MLCADRLNGKNVKFRSVEMFWFVIFMKAEKRKKSKRNIFSLINAQKALLNKKQMFSVTVQAACFDYFQFFYPQYIFFPLESGKLVTPNRS